MTLPAVVGRAVVGFPVPVAPLDLHLAHHVQEAGHGLHLLNDNAENSEPASVPRTGPVSAEHLS